MSRFGHNGGPTLAGDSGWVAVARSMRNHPIVGFHLHAKPADSGRGGAMQPALAFLDLIMECRYEDGSVMNGGRKMQILRGQVIGAVSWLAARWNWTPQTVRTFLDKLEADGMISRHVPGASGNNKHVGKASTVISLCNYDKFQLPVYGEEQTNQQTNNKEPTNKQQTSHKQATNEQQQYKDNKGTKEQGNKSEVPLGDVREALPEAVPVEPSPYRSAQDIVAQQHRDAYLAGMAIKQGAAAKSARSAPRTKGELDGSRGVLFQGGKLTVMNGSAQALVEDYPGIDLLAVCAKAGPEVSRMSYPTVEDAMSVVRKWAAIHVEAQTARASSRHVPRPPGTSFMDMTKEILSQIEKEDKR